MFHLLPSCRRLFFTCSSQSKNSLICSTVACNDCSPALITHLHSSSTLSTRTPAYFLPRDIPRYFSFPPSLHLPSPLGALSSCSSVPNHSTVLSGFGSTFTVHTINYVSLHFPITSPSLSPLPFSMQVPWALAVTFIVRLRLGIC